MRTSLLIGASMLVLLGAAFTAEVRREKPLLTSAHAALLQPAPEPESTESEQEYVWELIPVRHGDAVALSLAMGGGVAPMNGKAPKVAANAGGFSPLANTIPEGIQGIIAIPATNSLRVRGTPADIQELRWSVEAFDQPQARYRLSVTIGAQTVTGIALERETAHLREVTGNRILSVDLTPRLTRNGDTVIEVSGKVSAASREWEFATTTRVKPGYRARIAEFASLQGRWSVYLHAEAVPEEPSALPID